MDVKSAFLYGTIEEEVYVCQPPGFEDPYSPNKVYKVEKALYGLHQAPIAWYETFSTYLLENRFRRGIIDKTLFIKNDKGLQVKQKDDRIFISQDKYVADILKKFDFTTVKTASTLIEPNKELIKDAEAEDVDVHLYRSMIGALMYLTASRPDIMFAICACARFQVTPKTSHLYVVKRIFRYLKGQPKLGLWYLRDTPFDLEAFLIVTMLEIALTRNSQHEIVDFLTSSTIHYALTESPAIYASYIEQFWATAKSKTVKDVKQIHAKVDGKTVVISESSVRSDLHFNDEDGITCLSNDEMFENLALMGYAIVSTKLTFKRLSFPINGIVEGKGLGQPSEPQPPSSTAPPEQVFAVVSQPQKAHTSRRTKRGRDTEIPQSSGPLKKVGDEAVYTGEDDRMVRAATTAASLEAEQESGNINKTRSTATINEPSPQGTGSGSGPKCHVTTLGDPDAQTRFETASKQSHDPPLSKVNTSGSGEDNMEHQDDLTDFVPPTPCDSPLSGGHTPGSDKGISNINELMNICTQLSNRVLALEQFKTAQDLVIKRLRKKVKRLEKKQRARTPGMRIFKIGTSKKKTLDKENDDNAAEPVSTAGDAVNAASVILDVSAAGPSTSTAGDIFEDEMTAIADTLMAIRKQAQFEREQKIAREKATEQEAKDAALIEQIKDVQVRMDADALLAERLQQEEREQFTVNEQAMMLVDLIAERKRFFAAQRTEQIRNKPPTRAQLKNKMKWINDFVPMDSEVVNDSKQQAESSKKRSRSDHDKESVNKHKREEDDAKKRNLELVWI
nr:hypothetical protein [Tanacetum cinerariifolium]